MYRILTSQVISLGVTAKKLPTTPLEGRKYINVQNVSGVFVYIGGTAVTANTSGTGGFQLLPKATWDNTFTDNCDVYAVIASGSAQIVVEEGR